MDINSMENGREMENPCSRQALISQKKDKTTAGIESVE